MSGTLLLLWLLSAVPSSTSISAPPASVAPPVSGTLNVNDATAEELDELPGIGRTLAQRILEARSHRSFHKVADLLRVKGFGQKRLRALKSLLSVSGASTLQKQRSAAPAPPARKEGGDITSAQPAKEPDTEPTPDGPRKLDNTPLEDESQRSKTRRSHRNGPLRRHSVSGARSQGYGFSSHSFR